MAGTNYAVTNPKQIYVIFSGRKENKSVLSVESHLSAANPKDGKEGTAPQTIFGRFSRFVFSLISNGEAKTANMPLSDLPDILARTKFIRNKMYERELCPSVKAENAPTSPAYTVKMPAGEFKGKTPAEIILENEENKQKLNKQYKFLQDNLQEYPNNQQIMDAIKDAAELHKAGKLVAQKSSGAEEFTLYSPGPRPLVRKKDNTGKSFVYDLKIKAYLEGQYPIQVTVQNYYAPVETSDNGMHKVMTSQMDKNTMKTGTIHLSLKDWNDLMCRMEEQRSAFMLLHCKEKFAEADSMYEANRANEEARYEKPEAS